MDDSVVFRVQNASSTSNPNIYPAHVPSSSVSKTNKYLYHYGPYAILIILLIIIIAVVSAIASKLSSFSAIPIQLTSTAPTMVTKSGASDNGSMLAESVQLEQMVSHLRQFESRVIGSKSFNRTIDYLVSQLNKESNLIVAKYYFPVPRSDIDGIPILVSLPNISNASFFSYPSDFVLMERSGEARNWSLINGRPLSFVAQLGCLINDWNGTRPGDVVLVKRGNCTFLHKITMAWSKQASALLIYNDGATQERHAPLNNTRAPKNNTIPILFLSYEAGMRLINENISRIYIQLLIKQLPPIIVTNVCADTKWGDSNRTIVVGSHSDSVAAGPGLNDNGSGTAATLAIAINLARLLRHSNYSMHIRSRIRFCWWGAEESGLLGSTDFVRRAKEDGSLASYLVNLNFDMLASPNFIFAIYDGTTADNQTTPLRAVPGSIRISRLFVDYFERQHLPWDYTEFSGRSDYGPFLAEGIACGGLFSGADEIKSQEQRDRYLRMLGSTLGGMANTDLDPCYHLKCDTLENLNMFAYLHMTKAAAYAVDFLARLQDLNQWLYP